MGFLVRDVAGCYVWSSGGRGVKESAWGKMLSGIENFKTAFEQISRCFEAKVARPATFCETHYDYCTFRCRFLTKEPQAHAGYA